MKQPQTIDSVRTSVRAEIASNSEFNAAYAIMNSLAAVVACYGLFENSPAVVIGAMIIAMLLGPIAGVSLGLVDKDNALLLKSLPTLLGGFCVVYGTAFLLGIIHSGLPLTDEILSRTTPNLMDLIIAVGGWAACAFSMISPRLSVAFVGVAIATALVPPLASSAICLAHGEYALSWGALLLAFTNIVGIQVAGSLVMWLGGYRGTPKTARLSEWKRNLLSVLVLCGLAVFLGGEFRNLVSKQIYDGSVRKILTSAGRMHPGAVLVDVVLEEKSNQTIVAAVYRTPSPFTPEEVGILEAKLPQRKGTKDLQLRVRSVPISVATKFGYLFSDEDVRYQHLP